MKKLVVGIFALIPLLFNACSEEEPFDPQAAATGSYSMQVVLRTLNETNVATITGTATYEKKNATEFTIKEDGEVLITGTNLTESTTGFLFDITSFTEVDAGLTTQYSGVNSYTGTLNGSSKNFDGRFESAGKQLQFRLLAEDSDGDSYYLDFLLTKR